MASKPRPYVDDGGVTASGVDHPEAVHVAVKVPVATQRDLVAQATDWK
jgi:hypothetical protein